MLPHLTILAEGCPRHSTYRAKTEPTHDCLGCKAVWDARHFIDTYVEPLFPRHDLCPLCTAHTSHTLEDHWYRLYRVYEHLYALTQ